MRLLCDFRDQHLPIRHSRSGCTHNIQHTTHSPSRGRCPRFVTIDSRSLHFASPQEHNPALHNDSVAAAGPTAAAAFIQHPKQANNNPQAAGLDALYTYHATPARAIETIARSASMSQRQPVYRRPSWAQNDASYKIYMRKGLAADRSPGQDFGLENFSYDPAHLPPWQAPEDLAKRLPVTLRIAVEDWEYAGAAVCTALERIKKLDGESLHRGYPDKTRSTHHLSRPVSSASPAVLGADTPPASSPLSPTPMMPSGLLSIDKMSFEGLPRRHVMGMESPPFTPSGSQACSTPDIPNMESGGGGIPPSTMPDLHQVARQLSPISIPSRGDSLSSSSGTSVNPSFDEKAWECFLNVYRANLADIRHHALPRLKGSGYIIDRMRVELGRNREQHALLEDFSKWWAEMKPKVHQYEEEVRELHEPTVELIRMERRAQGLPV